MMNRKPLLLVFLLSIALIAFTARAEEPATRPAGKTVRVLAVGNSFSGNATSFLRPMAEAAGHKWIFGHAHIGGASFERHTKSMQAYEADPNDAAGKPYRVTLEGKQTNLSLRQMLQLQPWEYVTVQQASYLSPKPESFEPHLGQLVAYIRQHAPQAKLLIHETWAYRADHGSFKPGGFDQQQMYRRLHDNYHWAADYYDAAGVIPVGTAFQLVREDPRWKPAITPVDLSTIEHPKYPPEDYDLNTGYAWNIRVTPPKLVPDRGHATVIGRFLGSCVWYEFFFGDCRGNPYKPEPMKEADAALMREIAHRVVAGGEVPKAASVAVIAPAGPATAPLPPEATTAPAAPVAPTP